MALQVKTADSSTSAMALLRPAPWKLEVSLPLGDCTRNGTNWVDLTRVRPAPVGSSLREEEKGDNVEICAGTVNEGEKRQLN